MTLKVANDQKLFGEHLAWFAGTKVGWYKPKYLEYFIKLLFNQEESATFDAGCCADVKVVFFKPKMPEGQYNSMKSSYGVTATPGIEAGFYMDLTARSIDAVESIKKYVLDISSFNHFHYHCLYLEIRILAINDIHTVQ